MPATNNMTSRVRKVRFPTPASTHSWILETRTRVSLIALALTLVIVWSFWPTLTTFLEIWSSNPQYSHGYLVVPFALLMLWVRRERLDAQAFHPSIWGLPVLMAGLALRLAGSHYYLAWPERIALLPVLFGACLSLGGWACIRWSWPAIAFLFFMIPLPGALETALAGPLQRVATVAATNVLQTLGIFAFAEGNIIILSEHELGVVEACSGLRMFFTFLALSAGWAALTERPLWQRCLLVLSALPIAVACNVVRISATGLLYEKAGKATAQVIYHDLAGWLMMPLALALLWAELHLVAWLMRSPEVPAVARADHAIR